MRFTKTLKLGFIDEAFAECYVRLRAYTFTEYEEYGRLIDAIDLGATKEQQIRQSMEVKPFICSLFVEGKVPDDDGIIRNMTLKDCEEMPAEFYMTAALFLAGVTVPAQH